MPKPKTFPIYIAEDWESVREVKRYEHTGRYIAMSFNRIGREHFYEMHTGHVSKLHLSDIRNGLVSGRYSTAERFERMRARFLKALNA